MARHGVPRCKSTGKVRYRTEAEARTTLARIRRRNPSWRERVERRFYECCLCGGFHLTSQETYEPLEETA